MGNAASSVPLGAHRSLLNTTLQCLDGSGNPPTVVPFHISATAPLASNTEVYFTDIYAEADLGPSIYELISVATIYFATNAQPPTFQLNSTRTVGGDDTTTTVPLQGVAQAGPFTMTNQFAHLTIRYINLHAFNADEDFNVNCTLPDHIVISVANSDLSSSTTSPAIGSNGSFPATPVGSKTELANIPVACKDGEQYSFAVQGTIPSYLIAFAGFPITNFVTFLTKLVGRETGFIAQYGIVDGNDTLGIDAEFANAHPATADAARYFQATDPSTSNPLSGGRYTDGTPQNLTIAAPRLGSLNASLTAGSPGVFSALFGAFQGTFYTTDGSSEFSCTSLSSQALLSAHIELD